MRIKTFLSLPGLTGQSRGTGFLACRQAGRFSREGFMLIEVLVTCGVLTFGLIYTSRAFMNCLQAMAQTENYTTALCLAEERLWEWESQDKKSQNAESGTFSANPNFSYEIKTTEVDVSNLKEITLDISWKEGRRKGGFQINSYLFAEPKE